MTRKMNFITISCYLVALLSVETTQSDIPQTIDAMLPLERNPTRKVLMFSDTTIYEYDLDTNTILEEHNATTVFKNVVFPIDSARFSRRISLDEVENDVEGDEAAGDETLDVDEIYLAKGKTFYWFKFNLRKAFKESQKLIDNLPYLKDNDVKEDLHASLNMDANGMTTDYSLGVGWRSFFIQCDQSGLFHVTLHRFLYPQLNPVRIEDGSKPLKDCNALEVVSDGTKYELVVVVKDTLYVFPFKQIGKPDLSQSLKELNIPSDIYGEGSWIWPTVITLGVGIGVILLLLGALIGFIVWRRQKEGPGIQAKERSKSVNRKESLAGISTSKSLIKQ